MKFRVYLFFCLLLFSHSLFSNENVTFNIGDVFVTTPASDSLLIVNTIKRFSADIDNFQRKIGQYPELKIRIVVINDEDDYLAYAKSRSEIIEFSRAFYSRRDSTIYLRNPRNHKNFIQLNQIMLHEYIHHFVAHYWKNTPLWFNEGMAVYFSGDLSIEREFNFVKNYILGNSLQLEQMKYNYPENRIAWESFYAKSGLAVKYLYQKKYREFINFCDRGAQGENFSKAFFHSFYFTPLDYSRFFEEYSKKHFTVEILLASTGLIWGILPLILIIGWIRKKIIAARIRRRWDEEEALENEIPESEKQEELELK
ncbi:MAG: hypothetical protein APR54_06610 [Candidatus Cloacimonas sp. SDB]|nr:MAG: hypothetical protein APR54_06610 [Candidatus Cloacimonas sp. SDB]